MEISNFKELPNGNIEITFCYPPDYDDYMSLTVTKDIMWQISDYCKNNLSYAAQLKKRK